MLQYWDKTSSLTLPDGKSRTAEEIMANPNWGFAAHVPTILEVKGGLTMAIENFHILCSVYQVDETLPEDEALAAIEAAMEAARRPQPSAEGQELTEAMNILLGEE